MLPNQQIYTQPEVALQYARQSDLQPPEEVILRAMLPKLINARMLDLGVGGGRTTLHFAKWVREYVGVDYSTRMIGECNRRFAGYPLDLEFRVADARSMEIFKEGSFDFILFSFNGIDYVTHEDRLVIFREIRRVGKVGGHFCFSSHNLNWCKNFFDWKKIFRFSPKVPLQPLRRIARRFIFNRDLTASALKNSSYVMFKDGAHGNLSTYYVRPQEQLEQLSSGFTAVRIFALNGDELKNQIDLTINEDPWLYYLCELR